MASGTATKTRMRNTATDAPRAPRYIRVIGSPPRFAHQPVGADGEEDHQRDEDDEIGDIAVGVQNSEADRLQHSENESACDRAADDARAANHHHHESLDRDRSADAGI